MLLELDESVAAFAVRLDLQHISELAEGPADLAVVQLRRDIAHVDIGIEGITLVYGGKVGVLSLVLLVLRPAASHSPMPNEFTCKS